MKLGETRVPLTDLIKVVLFGKHSIIFFIASIASFAFSIAVILSTIGLMDGFEETLRAALQKSSGDIKIISRNGFFDIDKTIEKSLKLPEIINYTPVLQTEGFFMKNGNSRGVVLKGIEPESFSKVAGVKVDLTGEDGIVIGEELAKEMNLKVGDTAVIAFGKGNRGIKSLPTLKRLKVTNLVKHGVYDKDVRFVYLNKTQLEKYLDQSSKVNLLLLKLNKNSKKDVEAFQLKLRNELDFPYLIRPFWSEFATLLEAVEIEKMSITLVLQLIVIISIFNIAAFMIFISEKKAQDFFMFRALGLDSRGLLKFWLLLVLFIWINSCAISIGLTHFFDRYLLKLPFLQIPGEIYVLGDLSLSLHGIDYLVVFGLSLLWVMIVTSAGFLRLKKKSILYGLRQEFS